MLSLAQCRKILGQNGCNLSDSDLESLRDKMYGLADIAGELFRQQKRSRPAKVKIQFAEKLTDTELEKWEERAAIIEFEARLPRSEAEVLAFNFARSKRNPQ